MLTVEATEQELRLCVSTTGMSPEEIRAFLDWLNTKAAAHHERLIEQVAWQLSEQLKADWWSQNQARFRA
jgi:hypothetical protein